MRCTVQYRVIHLHHALMTDEGGHTLPMQSVPLPHGAVGGTAKYRGAVMTEYHHHSREERS